MLSQLATSFVSHDLLLGTKNHHSPTHFSSLTHWIESVKFDRALHGKIIEDLLLMPCCYTARRFSLANKASWRSDWQLIRPSSIALGVAYFLLTNANAKLLKQRVIEEIVLSGLSELMSLSIFEQGKALASSSRIAVVADKMVPIPDLNKKLRSLQRKLEGQFVVSYWRGRYSNTLVHDWALSLKAPVLYVGEKNNRVVGPQSSALLDCADHYIIFDQKNDKKLDRLVSELKKRACSVELVYWQDINRSDYLFD